MHTPLLVIGHGWSSGQPMLRLREPLVDGPVQVLLLKGELRFGVGAKRCIGHRDGDTMVRCPGLRTLTHGRQCEQCQRADTFRPCMVCDGSRCPKLVPAARRACRSVHHLYLADFGGTAVKVGTASDAHRNSRLHDQGPIAALRVAEGPGPAIKRIERFASTHTDLVEAFRRDQKRRLLSRPTTTKQAEHRLFEALSDLQDAGPPHQELFGRPHRVEMPKLAVQTRGRIQHQVALPVRQGRGIRGTALGGVGSVLLLRTEAGEQLLELGDLVGHTLDDDPPDDLPVPAMQLGLFRS